MGPLTVESLGALRPSFLTRALCLPRRAPVKRAAAKASAETNKPPRPRGNLWVWGLSPVSSRRSLLQQQQQQQQQQRQQQQRQQQQLFTFVAASTSQSDAVGAPPIPREAPDGAPSASAMPFSSVELPAYIRELQLGGWRLYFYPIPQYLKSIDGAAFGASHGGPLGGPSAWEGASLLAALQPQMVCVECCSSRLQELTAAAATAAAAAAGGLSLEEETQKQQRRLAKGFSLLTSFDGGNKP